DADELRCFLDRNEQWRGPGERRRFSRHGHAGTISTASAAAGRAAKAGVDAANASLVAGVASASIWRRRSFASSGVMTTLAFKLKLRTVASICALSEYLWGSSARRRA